MAQTGIPSCALVVVYHFIYILLTADDDEELFCSCNGCVQEISVAQLIKSAHYGEYDRFKLTALTLMHSNGISKVYLREQVECICSLSAVKVYDSKRASVVDTYYASDIAVEYACTLLAVLRPCDVVVIACLHDLVALAVGVYIAFLLLLVLCRGIYLALEKLVKLNSTRNALA